MAVVSNGLPETFEDELFEWPADIDPIYREIFDKLKKKEERLNELADNLAKKDTELATRAKESAPTKRISIADLRGEEWKRILQRLREKPIPPSQRDMLFAKASWGQYIIGAFAYV